jgi:hypothetical protein
MNTPLFNNRGYADGDFAGALQAKPAKGRLAASGRHKTAKRFNNKG